MKDACLRLSHTFFTISNFRSTDDPPDANLNAPDDHSQHSATDDESIIDEGNGSEADNNEYEGNDCRNDEYAEGTDSDSEHESDFQEDEDNVANDADGDQALYDGATITGDESMLSIFTFFLTHNLTGRALTDLLTLISNHIPATDRFKRTHYTFMTLFKDVDMPLVKHFYCSVCQSEIISKHAICEDCDRSAEKHYFIEIPIVDQLQNLLIRKGFVESLSYPYTRQKQSSGPFEDIYDGALYKEHAKQYNPLTFSIYHLCGTRMVLQSLNQESIAYGRFTWA